ncbi:hypothetical protein KFU94_45970 [Chloroflexi bacterium TSY]|nr:hypothetical protein [Chloroflexi bacterium TSY]
MGGIAHKVFKLNKTNIGRPLFFVLMIAIHAGQLPPFSQPVLETSLSWLIQSGVANQYLFNPVLQPSTFGVLLIFSIYLYLIEKPYWAVTSAALAAVFHSTYLPSAAILVMSYALVNLWEERNLRKAIQIGLLALLIVLPILSYNYLLLGPTTSENWQRAQEIIVHFRIPHHSIPEIWFNDTVYVKIAIVAIATLLVIRTRLFPVMVLSLSAAIGLTYLQTQINYDTLAFIAPWRISVFLVPLATSMIVAFLLTLLLNNLIASPAPLNLVSSSLNDSERNSSFFEQDVPDLGWIQIILFGVAMIALVALVGKGAMSIRDSVQSRETAAEALLWRFAGDIKQPDHIYLVPTHMAEFRLATGVPVVVTFKSHPYKDVEVIEWQERVNAVNDFYANISCDGIEALAARYGITHVVFVHEQFFDGCASIRNIHLDDHYGVFQIEMGKNASVDEVVRDF